MLTVILTYVQHRPEVRAILEMMGQGWDMNLAFLPIWHENQKYMRQLMGKVPVRLAMLVGNMTQWVVCYLWQNDTVNVVNDVPGILGGPHV